jgi:manganese-dependent ADP-ribose/CDP-alcohol diphosphatase
VHKASVPRRLGMPARYYDFEVSGWRFVALDGNDLSLHAYPEDSEGHKASLDYYRTHAKDSPRSNGAVGAKQLQWLESVLERAAKSREHVVLYCHFPVFPAAAHNLWNAKAILEVIRRHACVKAYINGHNHAGNHAVNDGVHYLTLKAMVDTEETSYAVVEVYGDRLEIRGFGRESQRTLTIR